jgi:lipopolysaccharide biosynthesis glycosyltransferase
MSMNDSMEILCTCDDRFVPHTSTMLCSLLEHNRGCGIHIIHSADASLGLLKCKSFVEGYRSKIDFYEVSLEDFRGLRVDGWVSVAVYFRLLSPLILPKSLMKVLYLDSDIVVRRPLTALWNTEIGDHALAAVEEFGDPTGTRFNSGVMLINLDFWRRNNVCERAIAFARNHPEQVKEWDQGALNAVLVDNWKMMPRVWNNQLGSFEIGKAPLLDAAIVHYDGPIKPWHWAWNFSVPHPHKYEYHRYRSKTPWRRFRLREGRAVVPWRLSGVIRSTARALLPRSVLQWRKSRLMN